MLYTLFRNLAVFDSAAHARAYEASAAAGRVWTCNLEHGLPPDATGDDGSPAAVEPRLLCIQLLHLLSLEDAAVAGSRQRPAPATAAEAVAARLVATTRCGGGALSEVRGFAARPGRMSAGQLEEALKRAERAYARTLTGLEAALRVKRLWSTRGVAGVGGAGQLPGPEIGALGGRTPPTPA